MLYAEVLGRENIYDKICTLFKILWVNSYQNYSDLESLLKSSESLSEDFLGLNSFVFLYIKLTLHRGLKFHGRHFDGILLLKDFHMFVKVGGGGT